MLPKQRISILKATMPAPITPEERNKYKEIMKLLPPNFGPGHPDWRIPSLRQKYLMTQGITYSTPVAKPVNPTNNNPYRENRKEIRKK